MIRLLQAVSNALETAQEGADFGISLSAIAREFDCDYYAYLRLGERAPRAISSYPAEWQAEYFASSYFEVDPVLSRARMTLRPFLWSAGAHRRDPKLKDRAFFIRAAEFEIRSGTTFPIETGLGGIALLTFASRHDALKISPDVDPVFAAATIGRIDGHFCRRGVEKTGVVLRPQEIACLKWYAAGKTLQDIATLERMKYSNVCYHMATARRKLNVTTSAQAAVVAAGLNII